MAIETQYALWDSQITHKHQSTVNINSSLTVHHFTSLHVWKYFDKCQYFVSWKICTVTFSESGIYHARKMKPGCLLLPGKYQSNIVDLMCLISVSFTDVLNNAFVCHIQSPKCYSFSYPWMIYGSMSCLR